MIGGSECGKANISLSLISHQTDNDKNDFHAKDPYAANHYLLIKKHSSLGSSYCYCNNSKALMILEQFNDMKDIYENTDEFNSNKKRKLLSYFLI